MEMRRRVVRRLTNKYANTNVDTTIQGSFVAIDPRNGHILTMVGGKNYQKSQWNHVTQAKRQPGSTFKAFVWTAAIDNGYSPITELMDQEVALRQYDGTTWRPGNYYGERGGLTSLRVGLQKSKNNIANRIVLDLLRSPKIVVNYAHDMGIKSEIRPVESIAMGTSEVTLLEITSSFCVFPNKGILVEPVAITKIIDRFGKVIYKANPAKTEAVSEETAYIMTDLLRTVMKPGGTGQSAKSVYGVNRPTGGKTGTTQDYTDAWFIGFIPQLVAGTWVGFDDPQVTLGNRNSGAVAALPIWAKFMKTVCDTLQIPVEHFIKPAGVIELKICNETKLIATQYCPHTVTDIFNRKYAPTETCQIHVLFAP